MHDWGQHNRPGQGIIKGTVSREFWFLNIRLKEQCHESVLNIRLKEQCHESVLNIWLKKQCHESVPNIRLKEQCLVFKGGTNLLLPYSFLIYLYTIQYTIYFLPGIVYFTGIYKIRICWNMLHMYAIIVQCLFVLLIFIIILTIFCMDKFELMAIYGLFDEMQATQFLKVKH